MRKIIGLSTLSSLVLAFWSGATVGVTLIALSKIGRKGKNFGMKSEIPFAPFLVLGAFAAFILELNLFHL